MRTLLRSRSRLGGLAILASLACGCSPAEKANLSGGLPSTPQRAVREREPSLTPTSSPFPHEPLQRLLHDWESRSTFRLGVVCQDLASGDNVTLGADKTFEAASLVKLPIVACLYARGGDLKQTMVFEERFRVGGSGFLKDQKAGETYTLRELAFLMLTKSDNVATDMLLEKLGMAEVERYSRELGMKQTTVARKIFDFAAIDQGHDNLTTPADMGVLLGKLARKELPGSAQILAMLSRVERRDLIVAGLPPGVSAQHKTGELTGFLHDAAILNGPSGRWVLVIMTQGGERKALVKLTKDLTGDYLGVK